MVLTYIAAFLSKAEAKEYFAKNYSGKSIVLTEIVGILYILYLYRKP